MMRFLIEGINPEPWTAPGLGTKTVGRRRVPITFPNPNMKAYQEAIHETVAQALEALKTPVPLFAKGTLLGITFYYWRQLEQFVKLDTGRKVTPKQPDVTNMNKATEDALQGLLYFNDKDNRLVTGQLVDVGPDVVPRIMILVREYDSILLDRMSVVKYTKKHGIQADGVWVYQETW